MGIRKKLKEKLKEALQAVLPIIGLVLLLSFTIAPISPSILLCFLIGGILLIAGIVFFTLGAELAMSPMGERVGTAMTQSKKAVGRCGAVFFCWALLLQYLNRICRCLHSRFRLFRI
ncbi:MAG: DUF1538 family protein [Gallintestinimicrobium sp.]